MCRIRLHKHYYLSLFMLQTKIFSIFFPLVRDFLHPNFVQYSLDGPGNYSTSYPRQRVYCYYHGEVEGYENSLVALSTCSGLRFEGVIIFGNETFGLEPVPESTTNEHLLYLLKDVQTEPTTCGVITEAPSVPSHEPFEPGQSLTSLLRRKRNLPQTSYVELALVVDNLRYNIKGKNETAVRGEMVEMANLLDGYYKPLNIRVVLVGLVIFKDSNPFSVDGRAAEVLSSFVKWRKNVLLPMTRNDVAQLIPAPYQGSILGMAFVGTVCSVSSAGGINVFNGNGLAFASTVVAHELGHNLGMNHDRSGCNCNGQSCIMSAGASGATNFSQCSATDFENLILNGGGVCLRNPPKASSVIGIAECGNGRLDEGEQCDCGKPEVYFYILKLTCHKNTFSHFMFVECPKKITRSPCRQSINSCDLPEYCDGKSEFCPGDFYVMDGLPCENNAAYCYEGRCQTYDYQCRQLFEPDAKKAADVCFMGANTQGNAFGNCGIANGLNYIKCSTANVMCGKVQCTNVDVNKPPPGAQVSIKLVQGQTCVNADFHLGPDVLDPAYVNPGSPCGKGQTCLDFACVNASALLPNLTCKAETTCNNRGECNNLGHCHCHDGWGPPSCDRSGWGGSIDSGPAQIELLLFLEIFPLVHSNIHYCP
uniref:ADAM metallopeptidase domain 9b n=1 Tax=Amphilophus citrinellus TaxID=61819 RepID=A0A3Q0QTG9_AMPCI